MSTPAQTIGPFFHFALCDRRFPVSADGALALFGRLFDGAGEPVTDALIEIWQAGPAGHWFGRCATDQSGRFEFYTVVPAPVPTVDGTSQAPHLVVSVFARGLLRRAVTRIYLPDHPANAADPLLRSLDPDRRDTLIARPDDAALRFDIHLQGPHETVFLHV
jgi:protocatechuate 3,4-dioxygenase alpha subunit